MKKLFAKCLKSEDEKYLTAGKEYEVEDYILDSQIIEIKNNVGEVDSYYVYIEEEPLFDLYFKEVRKEYTFLEAWQEYQKENVEIESKQTGIRHKKEKGKDLYFDKTWKKWLSNPYISMAEINNKWYINK